MNGWLIELDRRLEFRNEFETNQKLALKVTEALSNLWLKIDTQHANCYRNPL